MLNITGFFCAGKFYFAKVVKNNCRIQRERQNSPLKNIMRRSVNFRLGKAIILFCLFFRCNFMEVREC